MTALKQLGRTLRDAAVRLIVALSGTIRTISVRAGARPIFVVGSFNPQFEGNALEFSRGASQDPRVRCFAVVQDRAEIPRLAALGVQAVVRGGLAERRILAVADAVFTVGHICSDFTWQPRPGAVAVMLWHATPMKAVGKLNKPVPDPVAFYHLVTATSEATAGIMRSSFASEGSRIVLTGHPKTDPLLSPLRKCDVLRGIVASEQTRVISYLPTWRHDFTTERGGDFGKNAGPLLRIMRELSAYRRFAELLDQTDAVFLIKPHLWDDLDQLRALQAELGGRVQFLDSKCVDTTDLLRCSDIVVTDYSGVLTDWLILGKPTVCFTFDYEEYWSNRGNPSFDFEAVFRDLMVFDIPELTERLRAFLADPRFLGGGIERLSNLMHAHRDDRASTRIIDVTLECLRGDSAGQDSTGPRVPTPGSFEPAAS